MANIHHTETCHKPAAPVLAKHNVTILWLGLHSLEDLSSPTAFFERLANLLALMDGLHVLPAVKKGRLVLLVQTVVHGDMVLTSSGQEVLNMTDSV